MHTTVHINREKERDAIYFTRIKVNRIKESMRHCWCVSFTCSLSFSFPLFCDVVQAHECNLAAECRFSPWKQVLRQVDWSILLFFSSFSFLTIHWVFLLFSATYFYSHHHQLWVKCSLFANTCSHLCAACICWDVYLRLYVLSSEREYIANFVPTGWERRKSLMLPCLASWILT